MKLSGLELILLGKGRFASLKHVPCESPWRGAAKVSQPAFDPAQAAENRRLYPHLFSPERRS